MLRAVLNRGNIPPNSSSIANYDPSQKPSKLDETDMWDTVGEVGSSTVHQLLSNEQWLGIQLELINNKFVLEQDVAWKTCRERWSVMMNGERGTRKSVLASRYYDDEFQFCCQNSSCSITNDFPKNCNITQEIIGSLRIFPLLGDRFYHDLYWASPNRLFFYRSNTVLRYFV